MRIDACHVGILDLDKDVSEPGAGGITDQTLHTETLDIGTGGVLAQFNHEDLETRSARSARSEADMEMGPAVCDAVSDR